jgi:hypothetical protein
LSFIVSPPTLFPLSNRPVNNVCAARTGTRVGR